MDSENQGWARKIDREKLHLGNANHCILGQQYGSYAEGLEELGLDDREAEKLGFQCHTNSRIVRVQDEEYIFLDWLWTNQINRRLAVTV